MLKDRKKLELTLIQSLISQELQKLGQPNFVWFFELNVEIFSLSLVFELYLVWKCSKLGK